MRLAPNSLTPTTTLVQTLIMTINKKLLSLTAKGTINIQSQVKLLCSSKLRLKFWTLSATQNRDVKDTRYLDL